MVVNVGTYRRSRRSRTSDRVIDTGQPRRREPGRRKTAADRISGRTRPADSWTATSGSMRPRRHRPSRDGIVASEGPDGAPSTCVSADLWAVSAVIDDILTRTRISGTRVYFTLNILVGSKVLLVQLRRRLWASRSSRSREASRWRWTVMAVVPGARISLLTDLTRDQWTVAAW